MIEKEKNVEKQNDQGLKLMWKGKLKVIMKFETLLMLLARILNNAEFSL